MQQSYKFAPNRQCSITGILTYSQSKIIKDSTDSIYYHRKQITVMTRLNHYDSHHIKQKEGGVSKFNILAHRLYFRPNGEGDVRMVQMVGA